MKTAAAPAILRAARPVWLPYAIAGLMVLTIAGTVLGGPVVAYAALPVFLLGTLLLAVFDPPAALIVYLGYTAMEGMYKYLSDFAPVIYVLRPALVLALFGGWALALRGRRQIPRRPPLALAAALFVVWGCVETLHPGGTGIPAGIATLIMWYVAPMVFYVLSFNQADSLSRVAQWLEALVCITAVVSAFGIVQFMMGREWTTARLPGYATITATDWWTMDPYGRVVYSSFRPASTTAIGGGGSSWGFLGAMAAFGLFALPGMSLRRRGFLAVCLLLNVGGMLVSGVRLFVLLGLIEAPLWYLLAMRVHAGIGRSLAFAAAAIALITLAFWGAQSLSAGGLAGRYADTVSSPIAHFRRERGLSITQLPEFILRNPLGIGYQRELGRAVASRAEIVNRETQIGSIAADMGIPGLLLLASLWGGFLLRGGQSLRRLRSQPGRMLAVLLLVLVLGYGLMGLAGPSLQGADCFWLFAGTLFAMPALDRREGDPAAAQP